MGYLNFKKDYVNNCIKRHGSQYNENTLISKNHSTPQIAYVVSSLQKKIVKHLQRRIHWHQPYQKAV